MPRSSRRSPGDALAIGALFATALVIARPILRGGYLTYLDNPVHLAEIYDLAQGRGNGWSDLAFTGFPLGTLHSPLFYAPLAWLARRAVPVEGIYAGLLVIGFVATPLALYVVARRRLGAFASALLAYVALVQSPSSWGIGSPLGGMWTYGVASAALVLLAALWAKPRLTNAEHLGASALLAFAALTHLFVLPIVFVLAAVTTAVHVRARTLTAAEIVRRGAGCVVAALASADYWLTLVWVGGTDDAPLQTFRPLDIAVHLFLPSDPMYLVDNRVAEGIRWDLHMTDAVPMIALVVAGVACAFVRDEAVDALPRVGLWLAAVVIAGLLVERYFPTRLLGPVSWRFLDWARTGFALAAITPLSKLGRRWTPRAPEAVCAALVAVLLGFWWGVPLDRDCPRSLDADVADVRTLWTWIAANARAEWGRTYVQDTFGWRWREGGLSQSHLLVLTAHRTGVRQVGTYYGIVPYKLRWTLSEFGSLFSAVNAKEAWILEATEKTNAGVVVTSNPVTADALGRSDAFERLYAVSRYAVWRRRNAEDHPIAPLSPSNHVTNVRTQVGSFAFDLTTDYPRSRVLLKTGWHPWWRLAGIPGAWLRESPEGFLVVDDIPDGAFHVTVDYEPSRIPGLVTLVGFAILGAWALRLRFPALQLRRTIATKSA